MKSECSNRSRCAMLLILKFLLLFVLVTGGSPRTSISAINVDMLYAPKKSVGNNCDLPGTPDMSHNDHDYRL